MPTTVVSGFSPDGYKLYGKQFIDTFHQFATPGYDLLIYSAENIPLPRGKVILHKEVDAGEFVAKYGDKPEYRGVKPVPGWRPKDEKVGYCYRYDAIRFCWQLFYMEDAVLNRCREGDLVAWFDGDVVFHEQIPTSFVETTLAGGGDLAYLGRVSHTELGYWAVRITPETKAFIREIGIMYRSGSIFRLSEWHSAYVFDTARQIYYTGKSNDLSCCGKGSVWEKTALAAFSRHLKGKLKDQCES